MGKRVGLLFSLSCLDHIQLFLFGYQARRICVPNGRCRRFALGAGIQFTRSFVFTGVRHNTSELDRTPVPVTKTNEEPLFVFFGVYRLCSPIGVYPQTCFEGTVRENECTCLAPASRSIRLSLVSGRRRLFSFSIRAYGGLTALMLGVSRYFPRLRLVCAGLLFILALALIMTQYHFFSDIVAGVYLGLIVDLLTYRGLSLLHRSN